VPAQRVVLPGAAGTFPAPRRAPGVVEGLGRGAAGGSRGGTHPGCPSSTPLTWGERSRAEVVQTGARHGVVRLRDPAVRARCEARDLPLDEELEVVLVTADPATRSVTFWPA